MERRVGGLLHTFCKRERQSLSSHIAGKLNFQQHRTSRTMILHKRRS